MPKRKPKDPERSADMPHEWIERHLVHLEQYVSYDSIELTEWQYRRSQLVSAGDYHDIDENWDSIQIGEKWGGKDVTAFFRTSVEIPTSHRGEHTYLDIWLDGGEAQVIINGRHWQGLDWYRSLVPLGDFAYEQQIQIDIEAFIINFPYDERRHDQREFHCFERARLIKRDPIIEAFLIDARAALDMYLSYWQSDDNLEIESYLLHHLTHVCRVLGIHFTSREEAHTAVEHAHPLLKSTILDNNAFRHPGTINICAHSHLDIVYLWRIKETLRKNCRTITNMLSLMREFPEYCFSYSQPYLYEKLKDMYPDVYEEVKERIAEKRWEVIGAMYIEPDGNLPSGESMVRQLLFGKRFIQEEFGLDAQTCWLPDVFGVMYTLPQILAKSGVKYFLTNKQNIWNDTNAFPYDSFRWRGLDGSEVIAHFPPTHFAQHMNTEKLRAHWKDFRERETVGENLFIYGWADGGGGPTREMVATSLTASNIPGNPKTEIAFAEDFFARLAEKQDILPVWDDELYLEAHRGTYTTKGDLKWQNRKAEILYRNAEILSVFATLFGATPVQADLNEGWKFVLLNQFHDTLPGTHRPETVPDIKQDYDNAFAIGEQYHQQALNYLVAHMDFGDDIFNTVVFNTLGWERSDLAQVLLDTTATHIKFADGTQSPVQHYNGRACFQLTDAPSMGWLAGQLIDSQPKSDEDTATVSFDGTVIDSPYYRIHLNVAGQLEQIRDKRNERDVLASAGNVFQVFEDNPGRKFSAWDIAYHFETYQHEVRQTVPWTLVENGALFAVFRAEWQVLNSTIQQEMWLYVDSPRIDFHTRANWQDSRKLLKAAFPLNIRSKTATYDLPFGHIERPTHRNTSWEQAKFEVCGHKWADMSEGDYGVALLNDCKYGYDAHENVLRLSLLRSPIRPDDTSDIGEHQFSYALLPHAGNWRDAQVDRRAYEFNMPSIAQSVDTTSTAQAMIPPVHSVLSVDAPNVIIEALKQSEDKTGLILRTFDSHGSRRVVRINANMILSDIHETDLMEQSIPDASTIDPQDITIRYDPYEIKTHYLDTESQDDA